MFPDNLGLSGSIKIYLDKIRKYGWNDPIFCLEFFCLTRWLDGMFFHYDTLFLLQIIKKLDEAFPFPKQCLDLVEKT